MNSLRIDDLHFVRWEGNPIMAPQGDSWEAKDVFNPAAIVRDGRVHLLYRAEDFSGTGQWNGTSRIGLATSEDGLHFTRDAEPIVSPSEDYELPGGCEDPRVVEAEGRYWLTYTGYDGANARLCLASSIDLKTWEKHGVLFPELEWSKSGAILDVPVDGQYLMYFGDTHLWLARSTDLVRWQLDPEPVLSPREGLFDSRLVEPGPPPLLTDEGILLIYNAARWPDTRYAVGAAVFDPSDPRRVLKRLDAPFLEPEEVSEREGQVNQVVFVEGLVYHAERWLLYYGAADSKIFVATGE